MTPADARLVQDAMTLLTRVTGYSGAVLVLFTDRYARAAAHSHQVDDNLANGALVGLVKQRLSSQPSSPLILPGDKRGSW